jgi:hypothetical protein
VITPRPVPDELKRRPFTLAEGVAAGLTLRVLQGRRFRRLHRQVYVSTELALTLDVRVQAALLVLPANTVATGVTVLRLYGLDVGRDRRLHFSTTHRHQVRLDGIVVHRRKVPALRMSWRGLPMTTPAQTLVEASRHLTLPERVIAVDWLVNRGKVTLSGLQRFVDTVHDHGVRRARRAMVFARERVESPRETVLRLMIVFARLPEPTPNVPLGDQHDFVARPDLVYLRYRVLIEYDGRHHIDDPRQWRRDLSRREALEALGWRVIVVTAEDLRQPRDVVWRVYRTLRARGYDGPPPVFDDMWDRWFAHGA